MALITPTAVVLELMTMGQQSAAHLGELLRAASPPPPGEHQALAAEILRCCDRVIAALSRATGKKRKTMEHSSAACSLPVMPSKKRARGAEALREVKTSTTADGFIWRKYGQKDINGCKHPRLYYRCAYRDQGCSATRRVQQSQEEPAAYVIAYYGEHTCRDDAVCQKGALPPPTVVDFGSNAWGGVDADRNWGSPLPMLSAEQRCCDGEAPGETSQGWSSPSSLSEVEQEVQEFGVAGVEAPCYASPGLNFLDDCLDWESVINSLDFGGLHHTAML